MDRCRPLPLRTAEHRPRERLRGVGARYLSVMELLTAVVGSGNGSAGAHRVAERLLNACDGSVNRLSCTDIRSLQEVPGVGPATASRLVAAFELGRRAVCEAPDGGSPVRGPADVFNRMSPRLRGLPQEEFHALLLNTRHRVIREVAVTRGILDASLIHPREVFRIAVVEGAAGVVLVHNHPSGDPTPSGEDREVTRQLVAAGRTLGIPVLDHVIIGEHSFRSVMTGGSGVDSP